MLAPIASATLGLRRAHHGLRLLGMTLLIWAIEAGVWMAVGAAVGFAMTPIEGLYLVALASVFSMIPSGPGYAGTQDAAVAIGIKALGGTGGDRGRLPADVALRDRRPDHAPGLILLVARYGGLKKLRAARAEARADDDDRDRRRRHRRRTPPTTPRRAAAPRAAWFAAQDSRELIVWGVLIVAALIVRLIALGDRPFHHDESQDAYFSYLFRQTGDYQYNPLLHGPLRFYLTGADVRAVRRLELHRPPGAGADGRWR